jgi:hypothetical protein
MDLKVGDIILYADSITQLVLKVDDNNHNYTFRVLKNTYNYDYLTYVDVDKGNITTFYEYKPRMKKIGIIGSTKIMNILYG